MQYTGQLNGQLKAACIWEGVEKFCMYFAGRRERDGREASICDILTA